MSEEQARRFSEEFKLGYKDGVKVGKKWNIGQPMPSDKDGASQDYKDGFARGFYMKTYYKMPTQPDFPVDKVDDDDVDYEKVRQAFIKDGDVSLSKTEKSDELDSFEFDINRIDEEGEPSPKKPRKGGKSKKRRKSKKSKKAKRSRKQKK
jgi:AAA15 family ATPase/GTPase